MEAERKTISVDALRACAKRPVRLVRINLGFGPEVWAQFDEQFRANKKDRTVVNGLLVDLAGEEAQVIAAELGVPFDHLSIRF